MLVMGVQRASIRSTAREATQTIRAHSGFQIVVLKYRSEALRFGISHPFGALRADKSTEFCRPTFRLNIIYIDNIKIDKVFETSRKMRYNIANQSLYTVFQVAKHVSR